MKKEKPTIFWRGLTWNVEQYKQFSLLTLPHQEERYYSQSKRIADQYLPAYNLIKNLQILPTPKFQIALFPEESFVEKTQVPFKWATQCIRSNKLCCKYHDSNAPGFDNLSDERKRGVIHEATHIFLNTALKGRSRSFSEGFCELVPRLLILPPIKSYLDFLSSLKESDLPSFKQMDRKGISTFSQEGVEKNPGYASTFLGVTWLAHQFTKGGDYIQGTKKLLDFINKKPEGLYKKIKEKTNVDLENTVQAQLIALKLLLERK